MDVTTFEHDTATDTDDLHTALILKVISYTAMALANGHKFRARISYVDDQKPDTELQCQLWLSKQNLLA